MNFWIDTYTQLLASFELRQVAVQRSIAQVGKDSRQTGIIGHVEKLVVEVSIGNFSLSTDLAGLLHTVEGGDVPSPRAFGNWQTVFNKLVSQGINMTLLGGGDFNKGFNVTEGSNSPRQQSQIGRLPRHDIRHRGPDSRLPFRSR